MSAEPIRIRELLSADEIAALSQKSDLRGAYEVAFTWSIIAATFFLVARWPSLWTVLLGLVVLGNRQMALAILQHDGAHQTLMRSKRLNYWLGHWFCGVPNNVSMEKYWQHHRVHHIEAGTPKDPDRSLVTGYPTQKGTLARRFLRDLLGLSSLKRLGAIFLMGIGRLKYTAAVEVEWLDTSTRSWREACTVALQNLGPIVLWNGLFFLLLWGLDQPWLFALWWGAYLTTYSVFLRVRSFSEHGCTPGGTSPFLNTRTTLVGWLGRALWAPHYVNYHLEHHLLMTVPCYRLPALHQLLAKKGLLRDACIARGGYWEVIERLTTA